jgi:hypothetical protein
MKNHPIPTLLSIVGTSLADKGQFARATSSCSRQISDGFLTVSGHAERRVRGRSRVMAAWRAHRLITYQTLITNVLMRILSFATMGVTCSITVGAFGVMIIIPTYIIAHKIINIQNYE